MTIGTHSSCEEIDDDGLRVEEFAPPRPPTPAPGPRPLDAEALAIAAELGDDDVDTEVEADGTPIWIPIWERCYGPRCEALMALRKLIHDRTRGVTLPDVEAAARYLGREWETLLARAESAAHWEMICVTAERRRRRRRRAQPPIPASVPASTPEADRKRQLLDEVLAKPAVSPSANLRERLGAAIARLQQETK